MARGIQWVSNVALLSDLIIAAWRSAARIQRENIKTDMIDANKITLNSTPRTLLGNSGLKNPEFQI